ncbi:MAG: hypothetical protein R3B93_22400 [Bacteroidia bacterium]
MRRPSQRFENQFCHLIDIILDVEEEFDIEINDEEADQMITVEAVLEIISGKMKA